MTEPIDRMQSFRAAIASFIETRREAKLKGKDDDAVAASKYEYATWLTDAALRARHLKVVTHPIKFTHSSIKGGSSIRFRPIETIEFDSIGTHSLKSRFEDDFAISDAKHLDVHSLLMTFIDGKQLLGWIQEDDSDLTRALHDDPAMAKAMMESFKRVLQPENRFVSSTLAKQVYWLQGDDPSDNDQYHLLQPMFSSSLENVMHGEIIDARNAAFEARGTAKQKPNYQDHCTYPNLVARKFGGSNQQNVSPRNKTRGGVNYLLSSLPPEAWVARAGDLAKRESAFDEFRWFEEVPRLVKALAEFLKPLKEQTSTMEIRSQRDQFVAALADQLALFGTGVRARLPAGWTRDECRLPPCEQLWLDPERVDLPDRDERAGTYAAEDDEAFRADYERGDWPDEVASRFGNWLNARLRDLGLLFLAAPEMQHWASQAILEVAWPLPMQGRAKAGAA